MNLNELRDEAYRIAVNHGWHDEEHGNRHWVMMIVTEISEVVEADRRGRHADKLAFERDTIHALREMNLTGDSFQTYERSCFNAYVKDTFEDEISDIIIRVLDFAGLRNIDLSELPCEPSQIVSSIVEQEPITEVMLSFVGMVTDSLSPEGVLWTRRFKLFLFYVLEYCEAQGIDVEWFVKHKMHYNKTRSYKHGKKY